MTVTDAAPRPVDLDFARDFYERFAEAWNSHQQEAVLAMMTEDIVYEDSAWPRPMRGHAEVREFLDSTWRALPDLRFEFVDDLILLHPSRPLAASYWRGYGTNTGPIDPPGFAPTGKRIEFEGMDLHEYRDGKLCRLWIVFDMTDVSRQLGILPPVGSRGERALTVLQHLQARISRRR
jgi:steroid delta-isomerase-like uncharacterized protein